MQVFEDVDQELIGVRDIRSFELLVDLNGFFQFLLGDELDGWL